ncbi:patatin-like phospholipase family protein (plasmid) [Rhizobium grahamii]|uniref:Patatin-like phospholipase family protein n=2 Tax=Rhizobium grahamii TaxID=1120045 RepID=A0A5Q0CHX7_9HYPH|nr:MULTISPECIES: patatin-like phospholipase family protein [Rhizobium]QFY64117.1 patatin-like phospholipase family protein [Rhizobium grahamii]QRM53011.1 patatin-like phospholipase family protein [Rhizobium sp. BG6]
MQPRSGQPFRILSLDGGGAKGFYSLGVLKGLEGMLGCRLHERFDLVYGTSTGSIIAALICLGYSVDEIHRLYRTHVVKIMGRLFPWTKSMALKELATEVFQQKKFEDFKTNIGIVSTRWAFETPLIFKTSRSQAHGDAGNFNPGWGCTIGDAVEASCSAYPFFSRKLIVTSDGQKILAADGGFCANNPTLYAIADATEAFGLARSDLRVVSVGVGEYPSPRRYTSIAHWIGYLFTVRLLQKVLEINTKSMHQLRNVLFKDVATVRISKTYSEPDMAADLFESDLDKLDQIYQRGRESFREYELALKALFEGKNGDSGASASSVVNPA